MGVYTLGVAAGTYLLKGSQEDMKRWRLAASGRGQSFAAFVRDALDALTDGPAVDAVPSGRASFGPRTPAKQQLTVTRPEPDGGHRTSMCVHRLKPEQHCKRCDAA